MDIIPKEISDRASRLNVKDIRDALRRNGYADEAQSIKKATYLELNESEHFVYEIEFWEDGRTQTGKVFIEIKQEKPRTNYTYFADY